MPRVAIGLWLAVAACTGDKGVAPSTRAPSETLGTITIPAVNIVMAVGDTLSITPTGHTLSGTPITSFDSVLYVLSSITDTLRVSVSSAGLITARAPSDPTQPVFVNVVAFKDGLAAAEQAIIQVTTTKFSGATLSVQPVAPDSAILAGRDGKSIIPVISNPETGESVDNPMVRFAFTKLECQYVICYQPVYPAIATLTPQQLSLSDYGINQYVPLDNLSSVGIPGTVWVRANVLVYGVMLRDSVQYTITYPLDSEIDISILGLNGYIRSPGGVFIAPGGEVLFYNNLNHALGATITIAFDNPEVATALDPPSTVGGASGNITTIASDQYTQRRFLTAGDYGWTATIAGGIPPYTGMTIRGFVHVH